MSLVPVTKKIPAGLCGIFLGSLGVHKFTMGFPRAGLTMLSITAACTVLSWIHFPFTNLILSLMGLIGFIEGIIYLVKNDRDFYRDYEINRQEWF